MNPHADFPTATFDALEAELRREESARRSLYETRVATGNMLREEADRRLALVAAWREDLQRLRDFRADAAERWRRFLAGQRGDGSPPPPTHGISWAERRRGLLRELELRERFYPQWISSGRLLLADARHRNQCLECLLAIYEDGWDWRGSDGQLPGQSAVARDEYAAVIAEIDARVGTAQVELAL